MKRFNFRTYKFNFWLLFKSTMALLLICFVLLKPIRAFVHDFSKDKTEYNCSDTDEKESDEKESDETDPEETDDEEEDKFSINPWEVLSTSSLKCFINTEHNSSSEFHLGVVLPPPEIV